MDNENLEIVADEVVQEENNIELEETVDAPAENEEEKKLN